MFQPTLRYIVAIILLDSTCQPNIITTAQKPAGFNMTSQYIITKPHEADSIISQPPVNCITLCHHFPAYYWTQSKKNINRKIHSLYGNRPGRIGLSVASWNCRKGLLDKNNHPTDKIHAIATFLKDEKIDILSVSEAGIHGGRSRTLRAYPATTTIINNALRIPGYTIILPDSWTKYETARIYLYIKDGITFSQIKSVVNTSDLPLITLKVRKGGESTSVISAFYREFTGGVSGFETLEAQKERLVRMLEHWRELERMNCDCILLGDINLCFRKWSNGGGPQQPLIDMIQETQVSGALQQLVSQDTEVQTVGDKVECSIIDHVYSNCPQKLKDVELVAIGESDHLGVVVKKYTNIPHDHPRTYRVRQYTDSGIGLFLQAIFTNEVSQRVMECETLSESVSVFSREVLYYADIYLPIKTKILKNRAKPYVTEETKMTIYEKSQAWQAFKLSKSSTNLAAYKDLCKQVQSEVASDRLKWMGEGLQAPNTIDEAWMKAKILLGQTPSTSPKTITINGTHITNPQKLANEFADFHTNKITSLRARAAKEFKIHPTTRLQTWLQKRENPLPTFTLQPITINKLRKLISRFKPGMSLPSDNLDGKLLKLVAPLLEDALLHIVNLSLTSGTFDSTWKGQVIGPHHKKGDRSLLKNYRPVSIVIQFGKLTEMETSDQVVKHFTENHLFHNAHNGSLPNLDTNTALIQVYNHMVKAADDKKIAGTVFLDQSSAFDLVDHQLLLEKLECYNFSAKALSWFTTYLEDRTFEYQIESKRSRAHLVGPYGVPQGSVLGSLLYIISQNDLPDAPPESDTGQTTLYVDDDTEQESDERPEILQSKLQRRVDNITEWLSDNRMVVEPNKTKLIVSMTKELKSRRFPDLQLSIKVGDKVITNTPSEKLLGVVLSEDLTWRPHIWGENWRETDNWGGLIPQLIQRLGMLRYLGRVTSKEKMRTLIPGIFTSKMTYALPLIGSTWGFSGYRSSEPVKICFTKCNINRLQSL